MRIGCEHIPRRELRDVRDPYNVAGMSRLRRVVRRLLQVVISSLLTFLVAELVARVVFDPVPEHPGAPEGATRRRAPVGPDVPAGLQFVFQALYRHLDGLHSLME